MGEEIKEIELVEAESLALKIESLQLELSAMCGRLGVKRITRYVEGVPRHEFIKCRPAESQAPTEGEDLCESTEPELPEECAEFKAKLEGYIRVFKDNDCDNGDALNYALCALNVRNEFF